MSGTVMAKTRLKKLSVLKAVQKVIVSARFYKILHVHFCLVLAVEKTTMTTTLRVRDHP